MIYGEHQENWAREMASLNLASDDAWNRFSARVKVLLQVTTLDENEQEAGYSLDSAHSAFLRGASPEAYAATVKRARS